MTDEITPEIFSHMVQLAALELANEEAEYLRRQLNNQLRAVHELQAIPLDDSVGIASHGIPYTPEITPELRSDAWVLCENPEEIMAQAPETEEGYIVVPDIHHQELK